VIILSISSRWSKLCVLEQFWKRGGSLFSIDMGAFILVPLVSGRSTQNGFDGHLESILCRDSASFAVMNARKNLRSKPVRLCQDSNPSADSRSGVLQSLLDRLRPASSPNSKASTSRTIHPHPDLPKCDIPLPETLPSDLSSVPLPSHDGLLTGQLENGLAYAILRNGSPAGRIEAHLEVFAGSADELKHEQGLAHVVEHVAYMGNSARERLLNECAAQTNAYTDFHHTVFYASVDSEAPKRKSLDLALRALREVLLARAEPRRLEQERAAVLSEMTMVNTIEYRTECALLAALHSENRLAVRFPIGLEECIRSWTVDDVLAFHRRHYCPSNAVLYLVGDVEPERAAQLVAEIIGDVPRTRFSETLDKDFSSVLRGTLKASQSRAFPPIIHAFTGEPTSVKPSTVDDSDFDGNHSSEMSEAGEKIAVRPDSIISVFRHPLLQGFSLHVFSKKRIASMRSLEDLKRSVTQRIVAAALQIRFNVTSRGVLAGHPDAESGDNTGSAFNFVEFLQMDSAREACAVTSLDMVSAREMWPFAMRLGVTEMRRVGIHGITRSELERYSRAVLQEAAQFAAQADRLSNAHLVQDLMDSVATQSVFMRPEVLFQATAMALSSLTLEEVNQTAAEMCRHAMTQEDVSRSVLLKTANASKVPQDLFKPILVACVPTNGKFDVSDDELLDAWHAAQLEPVESGEEVIVPQDLLDPETKKSLLEVVRVLDAQRSSLLLREVASCETGITSAPFVLQYSLANGLRVNLLPAIGQPGRAHIRLASPGGRMVEALDQIGAVAVGARTLQEGGAFEPWSRQQVELFCVDNLIQVEIGATLEFFSMDIGFPTEMLSSALVLVNRILERKVLLEEDAMLRAKQAFEQSAGEVQRSLEDSSVERLLSQLSGNDPHILSIRHATLNKLTLDDVREAVFDHLTTSHCEISMAGDFGDNELPDMMKLYLGTVAPSQRKNTDGILKDNALPVPFSRDAIDTASKHFQRIDFEDTDERAIAFVSGICPSWWGYLRDGQTLVQGEEKSVDLNDQNAATLQRRSHPLFANSASALLQEVLNRKLFSALRETERLTYDAKFNILGSDRLHGAYYLAEVTAAPGTVSRALKVMIKTLRDVQTWSSITDGNIRSARRSVMSRHRSEIEKNAYLCELCTGMMMDCIPRKQISYIRELPLIADKIVPEDLQLVLQNVSLPSYSCAESEGSKCEDEDAETVSCVAVSSVNPALLQELERSGDQLPPPSRVGSTALSH